MSPEFNMLLFGRSDCYAVRRDVVEAVDVEGGGGVAGKDGVGMVEGPFKPVAQEMSFDPAVGV